MTMTVKTVDFSNVKDGGNFNRNRIPAGDYLAKIVKVEDAVSKKDDAFQFLFTIQIQKRPSSKFPYYCKLQENQLWKLRNLLIAAGKTVPKSKIKVDPNQIVGKLIGVTVEDDDYDGKEQSSISGVFPAAELAESGDDDDESADVEEAEDDEDDNLDDLEDVSVDDEDEPEEEPEEEEEAGDEYDAMERLDLRKVLKKLDPELKTSTKQTDDDLRNLIRELNAKKAAPAKKTAAKPAKAQVSDEELEELDIDDL